MSTGAKKKKDDDLGAISSERSANGGARRSLTRQTSGSSSAGAPAVLTRQASSSSIRSSATAARRHKRSPGVLLNAGLSITLFFALIQFFDPTLQEHHNQSLAHHQVHHNPLLNGLKDFAEGDKEALREQPAGDKNNTLARVVQGRERIMQLLEEAGVAKDLSLRQIEQLPLWETVVHLYGESVVIVGKDECAAYREKVPKKERILGVAGLFNTGTNLLDNQMQKNIHLPRLSLWQVPWGKHRMAEVKWNHTAVNMAQHDKHNVFPVVIIRDPYSWLQSMCSHPYATFWRHGKHHCPNLVANEGDRKEYKQVPKESFEVKIKFDKNMHYKSKSLVHLWSEWYRQYLEVDYPVLLVRFEDLVFQPVTVLREIADCVDGVLNDKIVYQVKSSKAHGSGTDYTKAIIKTADTKARPNNMTAADLAFAQQHLDPELMELFHYHFPTS